MGHLLTHCPLMRTDPGGHTQNALPSCATSQSPPTQSTGQPGTRNKQKTGRGGGVWGYGGMQLLYFAMAGQKESHK